jgi:ABC-type lipoprotein release transport system permease subunit
MTQFKAKIAKLENEARESTAKAWTMDDQNKKLTQSLELTQKARIVVFVCICVHGRSACVLCSYYCALCTATRVLTL